LLYADDIKLEHEDPECLQKMIDMVYEWTTKNGMSINIKKSASISPPSEEYKFHVNGVELPSVESYRYLGFTFKSKGVDWLTHMEEIATKARNHLTAVSGHETQDWTPSLRLNIYRTFIRPQMEYGAAIAWHVKRIAEASNPTLLTYGEEVHNAALEWITQQKDNHKVAAVLTGLPMYDTRLFTLAITFEDHLTNLSKFNPCLSLWRYYHLHPPWPDELLLPRIFIAKLQQSLPKITITAPNPKQQLYLRLREYLNITFRQYGIMPMMIIPRARKRISLLAIRSYNLPPVRELAIIRDDIRSHIMKWRFNKFGHNMRCTCGHLFHRTHINKPECKLLDHCPAITLPIKERFKLDLLQYRYLQNSSYNIIDSILNSKQFYAFEDVITYLLTRLREQSPY
jgi:hypothetical protein